MRSRYFPDGVMKDDSILNYYVLPLVGLQKQNFGDNFHYSRINKEGTMVYIKVHQDIYPDSIHDNKLQIEDLLFLYFDIPGKFHADMQHIIEGAYSKISDEAKHAIISNSGLLFRHRVGEDYYTSKLLFALEKSPALKDYYYDALKSPRDFKSNEKLKLILEEVELMEKVDEEDFIENLW